MKGFIKKGAVIVIAGMLLTGCGDKLTAMTEAEESMIINYSAGMIGKFNTHQMDGIVGLLPQEKEPEQKEPEQKEPVKEPAAEDKNKTENNTSNETSDGEDKPDSEKQKPQGKTMTEAFSIPGLEFKYEGYEVSDNYRQSDVFSMAAPAGKTYLVLNITIANPGEQDVECDLLSNTPVFLLKLNGASSIKNEITFLPDDLSTFKGIIRAGSKAQAFLIFEVQADEAADISSIQMNLNINDTSSDLKM